jgi:dipeptidyl aminopeptidase/acylaminoacyl peptidase
VVNASVATAADRVAAIITSPLQPGRIVWCNSRGQEREDVAWPLEAYCAQVSLVAPRELRVQSPDGNGVHGFLLLPRGDGPFPLLLDIHGGPVVQFGSGFFHELQTYAARGYAVLFVNPRGSQGYGAAFAAALHRNWAEPAFTDPWPRARPVMAHFHRYSAPRCLGRYGYMTTWRWLTSVFAPLAPSAR